METQRLPEGVELSYTDRAVHLTTNGALMAYLRQRGNGSLPLSRAILAAQNGTIRAENAREGGALFTLRVYKGVV